MVISFLRFEILWERLLSCCKNCTLTQVRQFLKKESAKIMQEDSKVNNRFCLLQCVYLLRSNRSIQYQINVNSIWYFFIVWNNYFRNWIDTWFDDQIWRIKSSVNFGNISDVICIVKLVNSIVRSLSNQFYIIFVVWNKWFWHPHFHRCRTLLDYK